VPVRTVALALAPALAAGCHTVGCTDKACSGSLQVLLEGTTTGDVVELAVDVDDGTRCVIPPSGAITCTEDGVLVVADDVVSITLMTAMSPRAPPATLAVVVTDAAGDVLLDDDVAAAWSGPFYPNGEACDAPSGCWDGSAHVAVAR
jgi:hypothetical protein